jgi:hypothetical protein
VLRHAEQIPDQSAACDLAEKSRRHVGARVMNKQNKMEDKTCR